MGSYIEMTTVLPESTYVKGMSSGATGYIADLPNPGEISLTQVTGRFIAGERLQFNGQNAITAAGISTSYTGSNVVDVLAYSVNDIKAVHQKSKAVSNNELPTNFSADAVLYNGILPNFSLVDQLTVEGVDSSTVTATCDTRRFSGKVV